MAVMTSRERVRAAFAHEPVDRVPMMVLLGESWIIDRAGLSFRELREMSDLGTDLVIAAFEETGSDSVTTGLGCWIGLLEALGCPCEIDHKGMPIEVGPCFRDPSGIAEAVAALDRSNIRELLGNSPLIRKMMDQTRMIRKAAGESKYICGQMVAPFSGAAMMVGVRSFMIMIGKKNPSLTPLLEYMADVCACIADMYVSNGCDMVQICDPCSSGDMISPRTYDEHVVPALAQMLAQFKGHDNTMLHVCGKGGMRLPRVMELGFGGFSVDSPVHMPDALEAADGRICMLGNFCPDADLHMGTPESVYAAAAANLEAAGLKGGYVLMPGCDLVPTTPLENIRAMVRASLDHAARNA